MPVNCLRATQRLHFRPARAATARVFSTSLQSTLRHGERTYLNVQAHGRWRCLAWPVTAPLWRPVDITHLHFQQSRASLLNRSTRAWLALNVHIMSQWCGSLNERDNSINPTPAPDLVVTLHAPVSSSCVGVLLWGGLGGLLSAFLSRVGASRQLLYA